MPTGKRRPGSKGSRGGAPKGALASVIGRLISGEPEIGPTARRATGAAFRAQRLSALCPPQRGHTGRRRTPRRKEQGWRSVGFEDVDEGIRKSMRAVFTLSCRGGSTPRRGGGWGSR